MRQESSRKQLLSHQSVYKRCDKSLKDISGRETWSLIPLVAIVIWLGVYPKPVLEPIDNSVKAMLSFMDEKAITAEAKEVIRTAKTKIIIEEVK